MNNAKIATAYLAAKAFIYAVEALKKRTAELNGYPSSGTKESGAVRRQSMSLTRALAEMRKP